MFSPNFIILLSYVSQLALLLAKWYPEKAVADPGGRQGGSGTPCPPPPPPSTLKIIQFKWLETEILTTEGSHMTINWLIFKNETCVAFRRSTKYQTCSNLYFFFDYPLMAGSARKAVVSDVGRTPASWNVAPTQSMTLLFQTVKIRQSKRLKLWNNMTHNDARLTWGRSY